VTPLYVRLRTASARGGRGVPAGADPTSRHGDYWIPALASLRSLGRNDVPGPTRSQAPADIMPAKAGIQYAPASRRAPIDNRARRLLDSGTRFAAPARPE
jgi:hypothetical protein